MCGRRAVARIRLPDRNQAPSAGGKGMRVVNNSSELAAAFDGARREADAYFGNSAVYVEKYLPRPRHVEAQILFDQAGKGVFLGERDCTVQRRHQKLIEETPSPGMTAEQRTLWGSGLAAGLMCIGQPGPLSFSSIPNRRVLLLELNPTLQFGTPSPDGPLARPCACSSGSPR